MDTWYSVLVYKHKSLFATTILSSCWEKKREYESCADLVSWAKKKKFHEERKREQKRILNFLFVFSCSSNVLVRWFRLHRFASVVRSLFGAHPEIGAATFDYLHLVLVCVHSRLYLVTSCSQLIFISKSSPSAWWRRDKHICFRRLHTCAEDFGPSVFF